MFCSQCGFEITVGGAKYCRNCGSSLHSREEGNQAELKQVTKQETNSSLQVQSTVGNELEPVEERWWKTLDVAQIVILVFGGGFLLGYLSLLVSSQHAVGFGDVLLIIVVAPLMFLLFWKEKVWGWGWYVVVGATEVATEVGFTEIHSQYGASNELLVLCYLLALIIGLVVYASFRARFLKRVNAIWFRSVLSGIIAIATAVAFTMAVALLIVRQ